MALTRYLAPLSGELGLPQCLAEVGIAASYVQQLADNATQLTRLTVNSPRAIDLADAVAL